MRGQDAEETDMTADYVLVIIPHEGSGLAGVGFAARSHCVIIPHEGSGLAESRGKGKSDPRDHPP